MFARFETPGFFSVVFQIAQDGSTVCINFASARLDPNLVITSNIGKIPTEFSVVRPLLLGKFPSDKSRIQ
jgi:hypothetical protein